MNNNDSHLSSESGAHVTQSYTGQTRINRAVPTVKTLKANANYCWLPIDSQLKDDDVLYSTGEV